MCVTHLTAFSSPSMHKALCPVVFNRKLGLPGIRMRLLSLSSRHRPLSLSMQSQNSPANNPGRGRVLVLVRGLLLPSSADSRDVETRALARTRSLDEEAQALRLSEAMLPSIDPLIHSSMRPFIHPLTQYSCSYHDASTVAMAIEADIAGQHETHRQRHPALGTTTVGSIGGRQHALIPFHPLDLSPVFIPLPPRAYQRPTSVRASSPGKQRHPIEQR